MAWICICTSLRGIIFHYITDKIKPKEWPSFWKPAFISFSNLLQKHLSTNLTKNLYIFLQLHSYLLISFQVSTKCIFSSCIILCQNLFLEELQSFLKKYISLISCYSRYEKWIVLIIYAWVNGLISTFSREKSTLIYSTKKIRSKVNVMLLYGRNQPSNNVTKQNRIVVKTHVDNFCKELRVRNPRNLVAGYNFKMKLELDYL